MAWRFRSGAPVTVQIVDRIRVDILSGVYPRGSAFPTVRGLATEAAVNPNTMQKALLLLESEGLLVTRGTAGRWVTDSEETLGAARLAVKDKAVGAIIRDAREAGIGLDELIEKIKKGWETK